MNEDIKRRKKEITKHVIVFLGLGIAYYVFYSCTNLSIPCLFHTVTGLKCPGCGITHLIVSLSHGDYLTAYHSNPFLFFLLLPGFLYLAYRLYLYVYKNDVSYAKWEIVLLGFVFCGTIAFGILRNMI